MLVSFVHVHYCYEYLIDQIPVGLLIYSHIPTALLAVLFSGYVLIKARNLPSVTLFVTCVAFAAFCILDLGSWFAFLGSASTMFLWSLLDYLTLIMFFFSYYFFYSFITGEDLPGWQKLVGFLLLLPTALWTFLGYNLPQYDANYCQAIEDSSITNYLFVIEAVFILAVIAMAVVLYRRFRTRRMRREIVLAGFGVSLFLAFFFSSTLLVSLLAESSIADYVYNFEIYGLFGMPILLIYLGYLIVRYKAFNMKIFGAQALVFALVAVIGSEFAFINSLTNRILVSITLVLTGAIGIVLIRSVSREIAQRERIEKLARELEKANDQQVTLIHFITHQIKGFVTKSRNIFSMMLEGDLGPVPESMRPMVEEGFRSDTQGATTIQEILNASNIKSGKVTYKMEPFDIKALVDEQVAEHAKAAEKKGVTIAADTGSGPLTITGDRAQLVNVFKNLLDNSVKYTPKGEVRVTLVKQGGMAVFQISDSGVGITPEDMKNLFTEGGHGKESAKVNVESTGFGLYIVKNIVEAHKGRVWAESEGAGQGSKFTVELPA